MAEGGSKNGKKKITSIFDTKEGKDIEMNILLLSLLSSFIIVIKNHIMKNSVFNFGECMSTALSIFMIVFMFLYKDKDVFKQWKENFSSLKKNIMKLIVQSIVLYLTYQILTKFTISNMYSFFGLDIDFGLHYFEIIIDIIQYYFMYLLFILNLTAMYSIFVLTLINGYDKYYVHMDK